MATSDVTLRAVREDDLPFLQDLITDPGDADSLMWRPFAHPREWQRRWDAGALVGERSGTVVVAVDDQPAGFISWEQRGWFGHNCWSLGIHLARRFRGQGIGARVHQLAVDHLFSRTLANRVEAYTELDNIAERRALEKCGFTREGTLRGVAFRGGQWHDGVLYSIIRDEWPPDRG
jgi:RimJ/RimL family protein N-acetyltransferase